MSESIYKAADLSKVAINPSGLSRAGCEMKWATHALLGVDKRRGPDTDVRDRGKAMHKFADVYVRHYAETGSLLSLEGREGERFASDIFEDLHDAEGCDFEEETCREILEAARAHLPALGLEDFTVEYLDGQPLVELDLHGTYDGIHYQAIVDAVLRHKVTGELWVVDWKTTNDAINITKSLNYTFHDMQLALQRLVLALNGVKVDRSALVQIRSLAPQPPPLTEKTKKITRSVAKLACDVDTYRAALIANGEDPDDDKLTSKYKEIAECVFVRWLPDVTSPDAQAVLVAEILGKSEQLYQIARGERAPVRQIANVSGHAPFNSGCRRCDYDKWCAAAIQNGGQPDFALVGVDYKRNDKATFASVDSVTPTPSQAYAEYTKAYGKQRFDHQVFTP